MKNSEKFDALNASNAKGFQSIINGLGLLDGAYLMLTDKAEDIFAIKEIKSSKTGKQYAITLVACTVTNLNGSNQKVYTVNGSGSEMAVSADQWLSINPNTKYEIEVVNGRVKALKEFTMDNIVEASEVVTNKKKSVAKV